MFKLRIQCPCNMNGARFFVIVSHTLCFSKKNTFVLLWLKIVIITAIVKAMIFVYKWTKRFWYCSAVQWSKIY